MNKSKVFFNGWAVNFEGKLSNNILLVDNYALVAKENPDKLFTSVLSQLDTSYCIEIVGWSFGCLWAYKFALFLRDLKIKFNLKLFAASLMMVDKSFGIPKPVALLTARKLNQENYCSFIQKTFGCDTQQTPKYSIDELRDQLLDFIEASLKFGIKDFEPIIDKVYVSKFDKIVSEKNLINYWGKLATIIDDEHASFLLLNELTNC